MRLQLRGPLLPSQLGSGPPSPQAVTLWAGGRKPVMDAAKAPWNWPRQKAQQAPSPSGEDVA